MRSVASVFLLLLLPAFSAPAGANPLDKAARLIEEVNMQHLHEQQTRPGISIDSYQPDGCSGGLSDSWKTLAQSWPEMARTLGDTPPWEHCCIAHDLDYWRGESIDGFDKRLQSDLRLRQCVEESGRENGADIAARLGVPEAEVIEVIDLTAELMFYAVRIGGGPCTGLAWRWGHGWPPCGLEDEPPSDPPANMVELPQRVAWSGRIPAGAENAFGRPIIESKSPWR